MTLIRSRVTGAREAAEATRAARREANREVRDILARIAERNVVPTAKSLAPSIVRDSIVARATTRSVYITTTARGMRRRRFGLLEHGGQVKGPIRSKRGKPLPLRVGGRVIYRQSVTKARTYRAKAFMRRAIRYWSPTIERRLESEIAGAIQRRIDGGIATRSVG
jgi:hypothetical protein